MKMQLKMSSSKVAAILSSGDKLRIWHVFLTQKYFMSIQFAVCFMYVNVIEGMSTYPLGLVQACDTVDCELT